MKFNQLPNCIKCRFNNSPWPMYVSLSLAEQLGGTEGIEKEFIEHDVVRLMPRSSSERRPWTPLDWELMQRNKKLGKRHWRYNPSCIVGHTRYYGYGYDTEEGFQFYDWNPERPSGKPVNGCRQA